MVALMKSRTAVLAAAVVVGTSLLPTVGMASSPPAESGPYIVEHAMGSTEIPAAPERIVVLDSPFLDTLTALDIVPVGATEGFASGGLPSYLPDEVHDTVTIVGETNAPNLEAIAAADPDLILGSQVRHEAIYEQLSAIAPTVFSESSGTNWTEQVTLTGAAVDRSDDAAQLLDDFAERAATVGAELGADEMTATIVRFLPDQTRLYGPGTFSGSVLTAVGFDLGDKGYADYSMALISVEEYERIEADVVFVTTYGSGETDRPAFDAVWENLEVVQNDMVFDVPDDIWMTGIGVLGANLILDDLITFLGSTPSTSTPA